MSGMTGVIYTDGRPANVTELAPAIEQMRMLGPDGLSTWAEGGVALAHLALHTTPEAEYEQWPLINARGDVLLADARIDNRDELLRALTRPAPQSPPQFPPTLGGKHLGGEASRPITDAELILAAHEKWGNDAPAHLIGDFAYLLWQPKERHLLMVRSPFGMKGLYYRKDKGRLLFATTLRGVQALDPNNLTLNYPWLASFLTFEMNHFFDESAFCEIAKVAAAHYLDIDIENGTQKQQQFWDLIPNSKYAAWSDEEWVEGFRECFEQVVADSLRSNKPISMSVSGGLDSSSIALVAHRLMHEEGRVPKLPTYCYTFRAKEWPDTDESEYRNAVIARLPQFESEWIDLKHAWTWDVVEAWNKKISVPINLPNGFTFQPRIERACQQGCRIMLSGSGGDIVTGGEDYGIIPAFYSLPWSARLQELPYFTRQSFKGAYKFTKKLIREALPSELFEWIQKRRGFVDLHQAECERIANRKKVLLERSNDYSPLQRLMYMIFSSPLYHQAFEQSSEIFAVHGMEYRCPFYDRRLVEMAFQQPIHLRIAQGRTRVLLKRALEKDLPQNLIRRRSKASFSNFTAYSISEADHARAVRLPENALTVAKGWLDLALWEKWATSPRWPMQPIFLHRVAHLEEWLAQLGLSKI
jgi:asparagine synthase (glutamine-hydrolysing)